ncbi:MAG: tripartite tricarboxylate transporter TctB family protein [Pseudomonadota bacterium]
MSIGNERVAGPLQQALPAAVLLALGLWVGFVSFTPEDPQPYLFPQIISVALVFLSSMALVRAIRRGNRTGAGMDTGQFVRIIPVVLVMAGYVFLLIPNLGFYASAFVAFLTLFSFYDADSHALPRTWLKRFAITAGFISVIYLVFALALQVQTPRGWLI